MQRFIQYAIGDIHGMRDQLEALHALIGRDIREADAKARIIHLGDYVDRGPDSFGVLEYLIAFEVLAAARGWEAVALRGNHEQMFLDALENPNSSALLHWLENGGEETLLSYAEVTLDRDRPWIEWVPASHQRWLAALPTIFYDDSARLAFVHAGISPAAFPDCPDEVRIWTRSAAFFDHDRWPARPALDGLTVIHGHTPTDDLAPEILPHRINIDTGCVFGGRLTSVALESGRPPRFLSVS